MAQLESFEVSEFMHVRTCEYMESSHNNYTPYTYTVYIVTHCNISLSALFL